MSFKDYLKNKIGVSGLIDKIEEEKYLNQYYYDSQYVNTPIMPGQTISATTTTSGTGGAGGHAVLTTGGLHNAYNTIKNGYSSSSTGNAFTSQNWPDLWSEKQKEALAKMEMTFDPEKKEWVMRLSIDIRLPQEIGIMAYINNNGKSNMAPMDQLIEKMKSAKKQLIEKLTSKIILAELIKPREIKK